MPTLEQLVDHIDQPGIDGDASKDISLIKPDITWQEALAVQLAVKRRRVAEGDRIIGHQGSFTSASVQTMFPGCPVPMFGTLLRSLTREDGDEVTLDADTVLIESEMAVVLGKDLEGPDLTVTEVQSAVAAYLPAIEVAPLRPGVLEKKFSYAHMIAVQKAAGGFVVLGPRMTAPIGFDPRLEGCLVSMNGRPAAGATGFEAMGHPLRVVANLAAALHPIGEKLWAGQVIMTGSLAPPQPVTPDTRVATLDFQTLGRVSVRFAPR